MLCIDFDWGVFDSVSIDLPISMDGYFVSPAIFIEGSLTIRYRYFRLRVFSAIQLILIKKFDKINFFVSICLFSHQITDIFFCRQ